MSGTVTLDGQPLVNARVSFEPRATGDQMVAGPGAYGSTDEQGRFELECMDGRRGAVVGPNRVSVSTFLAERRKDHKLVVQRKEEVPARYNSQTKLEFVVPPAGSDTADFDLVSK